MNRRSNTVTMKGNPVTLVGNAVKAGDKAPNFTALTKDLEPYTLADAGSSVKIISVVPSLDTGVCEAQTIRFNQEAANLKDTVILTISVDLPFAHKRFCTANEIDQVITLSDHKDLSFGLNYGYVIDELRLLSRGIVVIDRENVIRYVEYVKEVGSHPDYEKALEAAKKLV
jgi:thiol peroxidase